MDIDAAETRQVEHDLRQDQTVGSNNHDLGPNRGDLRLCLGILERQRLEDLNAVLKHTLLTADGCKLMPRPAGRSGCVNTSATSCPAATMACKACAANSGVPAKISFMR